MEHLVKIDHELGYDGQDSLLYLMEGAGVLDKLEELQSVPNETLYNRIVQILENSIGIDDQQDVQIINTQSHPEEESKQQFQFNI